MGLLNWGPIPRKYEDPWWRQLTINHVQRTDGASVELERLVKVTQKRNQCTAAGQVAAAVQPPMPEVPRLWSCCGRRNITNTPITESGCNCEKVRNHEEAVRLSSSEERVTKNRLGDNRCTMTT